MMGGRAWECGKDDEGRPARRPRVAVFGLGYVGTVSAACLASRGHTVIGVDVSPDKVAMVTEGRTPVVEERIGELIAEQVRAGRLTATSDAAAAVAATDLALVCVGTPSTPSGSLLTAYLEQVADEIGAALVGRAERYTVVIRSTMLPTTARRSWSPAWRRRPDCAPAPTSVWR